MKLVNKLEESRIFPFFIVFFCFFIILFTIFYQKGGYLHAESRSYLLQYTDKRTLLQKIFDLKRNEDGAYQGRELSYAFDMIDSYFIRYSIKMGFPHFYSITYFLGIIIILTLSWFIFHKYLRLKSLIIFMLLAGLFLTSPPTFFSYVYARSAKLLSGVFFTLIIFILIRYLSFKNRFSRFLLLIIPFSFLMSISDRQGYYFLLSMTMIFFLLVIYNIFFNKKKVTFYVRIFLLFLISTIISLFYIYFLGPFFIKSMAHYSPDLSSLSLNMQTFQGKDPRPEIKNFNVKMLSLFFDSSRLFFETVLNFFGHINKVAANFMIVILLIFVIHRNIHWKWKINKESMQIFLVSTTTFVLILIMFFLMVVKHPPILWSYVRYTYYTFPANVIILLFSGFFISLLMNKQPKLKVPIIVTLSIMLFFNILAIPGTYQIIETNMPSQKITFAPQLFKCLKEKNISVDNYILPEDDKYMCRILR